MIRLSISCYLFLGYTEGISCKRREVVTTGKVIMTALVASHSIVKWGGWVEDHQAELTENLVGNAGFDRQIAESAIRYLVDRLAMRLVQERGCSREEADYYVALGFDFLAEIRDNPGMSLGPTLDADVGWHNLILYTGEYASVCAVLVGHFVNHIPSDIPGFSTVPKECCGKKCHSDACTSSSDNGR